MSRTEAVIATDAVTATPIECLGVEALIPIDSTSPVPRYRQIANQLAALILDAKPGARLPSEFDIVTKLSVSRATATQALRDLNQRGLVDRRQGRGTFVADSSRAIRSNNANKLPSFSEDLRASGRTTRERVIAFKRLEPPVEVAAALAINDKDETWQIERVIISDGEPVVHLVSWLPCTVFRTLTPSAIENSSLYEQLLTVNGTPGRPSVADEQWSAVSAPPATARLLDLRNGMPVMRVVRTAYLEDQTPAEYVVSYVRGETFAVSIHIDSRNDGSRVLSCMAAEEE